MNISIRSIFVWAICLSMVHLSCHNTGSVTSAASIAAIRLKRGEITLCGAPGKQFGKVDFETSCSGNTKEDFNLGMELLHSFEYDESEKAFAKVIDKDAGCAMAYWGVAMCNNHPLWTPPTEAELEKGAKAIMIAKSIPEKTKKESDYIDAQATFYKDWHKTDHHTRSISVEHAMEKMHRDYPTDKEVSIFYALALDASADPADQSYANQKKAGKILFGLYLNEPDHPGVVHYIIHTYDYPGLAILALPAARRYAAIAPSSAHAQHMPSHIFTRLGLWNDCIKSNLISVSYARCYAGAVGIQGAWDEELHGLDYLVYAYLQKGENKLAKAQCRYLSTIGLVYPVNFKDAYAFAAIPSRYILENKLWADAVKLQIHPANFPWEKFPWQRAMVNFTRLLGFVHLNKIDSANMELQHLELCYKQLAQIKDVYKANQVKIQITSANAWLLFKTGKNAAAIKAMDIAADMEDRSEKHPVTPCEIVPARELLGDMLLEMNKPAEALIAYEADLERHPNRFNGLYGAGTTAKRSDDVKKAIRYYRQLLEISNRATSDRSEILAAEKFVKNNN